MIILIKDKDNLCYNTTFKKEDYIQIEPKFVVDSSLRRLARMMRNLSLDTANDEYYKYADLVNICNEENRIIITRNKTFKQNSKNKWIHLKENKVEIQMKELIKFLDLKIKNSLLMTRCVKCNNKELKVVTFEDVKDKLENNGYDFKHGGETIDLFWICEKCDQVYWEGGQFKNARKNYQQFVTEFD
jgi:uncharacterized protein with PIN domain